MTTIDITTNYPDMYLPLESDAQFPIPVSYNRGLFGNDENDTKPTAPNAIQNFCVKCDQVVYGEFKYSCSDWAHDECVGSLLVKFPRDEQGDLRTKVQCPKCRTENERHYVIEWKVQDKSLKYWRRAFMVGFPSWKVWIAARRFEEPVIYKSLMEQQITIEDIFDYKITLTQLGYLTQMNTLKMYYDLGLRPKHFIEKKYEHLLHINDLILICSLTWGDLKSPENSIYFPMTFHKLCLMDANYDTFHYLNITVPTLLEAAISRRMFLAFQLTPQQWKKLNLTEEAMKAIGIVEADLYKPKEDIRLVKEVSRKKAKPQKK